MGSRFGPLRRMSCVAVRGPLLILFRTVDFPLLRSVKVVDRDGGTMETMFRGSPALAIKPVVAAGVISKI